MDRIPLKVNADEDVQKKEKAEFATSAEVYCEIKKIIRLIALKGDKRFKNQNLKFGIITIDLSDIKSIDIKDINDSHGHEEGDTIIK